MIRRAEVKDIPAINDLLGQVLLVHHVGRPDIFKEKGQKYTEEQLVELIGKVEDPIFVYEDENGKVIGHCFCQTFDRPESTNSYAYKTLFIDDLCIDENARGKNVGKEMYEYAKQFAKENGYYNLTLHAWECNPKAVGFYSHMGMNIQQYTMEEIL
ncbi:MAG: GNAT family N-acetyltransferase [Lachnospiraceae bacterium]|nr:GNAT family N-acetyltransferase [Lachnospiraceae bacterium]